VKQLLNILLQVIGRRGIVKYALLGLLTGLFSFLFINTVTRVIRIIIAGDYTVVSNEYIIFFSFIILLFVWSKRRLALFSIDLSQRISWSLRKQILSLVLKANYQQLSIRKTEIQATLLSDVSSLTNASMGVIDFSISLIMAISCFAYLASISLVLFFITIAVAVLGIMVYYASAKKNMRSLEKARDMENKFQSNFNAILYGFKEIFIEPKKGKYIYEKKICDTANDSYRYTITAITGLINNQMTGQVLFYILISSVLLLFSLILKISAADIVSFVFTLLYLLGSLESVMGLFPTLMRAGVASRNIMNLKKELLQDDFLSTFTEKVVTNNKFELIEVCNLEFYYGVDTTAFGVGPVNLDIKKGEVIFIYGGNGSGKTTYMYSLLGLCIPSAGEIRLDGVKLENHNYADYRSLFSVVFSDFYMFEEILGEEEIDRAKWDFYIHLFELDGKVVLEDRRFSTTDLSTGQRKRLALIIALLEKKPILVIDEWAADQDPHFRKKFYTEIIPMLKGEGITIIAITHDDRYYHCADKLCKMDEGKLIEESIGLYQHGFAYKETSIL
jgi:putative pyoverdin transport system ATP-binding/permease protein